MDIVKQLRQQRDEDDWEVWEELAERAANEIDQLRDEKRILKIALQNIKECISHRGEGEKDRDQLGDHAYMVTAIVIGLGSVR